MLEVEIVRVPSSAGRIGDEGMCRQAQRKRLKIAAAVSSVLLVAMFISWILMYLSALNPGD